MTIREVAQLAGVSPAAVSRYLNGGPVSAEKADRIRDVIEQTGFQPNSMARTMRTGVGNQIGVITPRVDSESTAELLSGISERLLESGFDVLLGVSGERGLRETSCIGAMQHQQVAGIILMGTIMTPERRAAMNASSKPIVVTGQNFEGFCCVYYSDYEAMREMTRRLIRKGYRRIAYIGVFEEDRAAGEARRLGVQDAWNEETDGAVPLTAITANGFLVEDGRAAMQELLRRDEPIDAVICASDQLAIGAMEVLRAEGRRIPQDIAVTGVGDSWADIAAVPSLTTVRLPYRQCGREAAEMLLRKIREPETGEQTAVRLGYEIMERNSA